MLGFLPLPRPRAEQGGAPIQLVSVCVIAFALRAIVVANMLQAVLFADMQEYHDRALHLVTTGALTTDAFRVPLYPIFIAGVFTLFGQSLFAVRMAQALIGTGTVALTYALARRVVVPRVALIAAGVVAAYPALLLYSAYLMAETLFSFLVVLAIVLWLKPRVWTAVAAGLALGAATLTRSVGLAVLGGIVIAELRSVAAGPGALDRRALARMAGLLVGVTVVMMPWIERNYSLYHRIIPTDTSSGFNVLLGNYPGATGRHPGIAAVEAAAQQYWRGARNDLERSDIGLRVGRAFVTEHPARAAKLAALKVAYFLGVEGREHAWGYSYHVQGKRASSTVWAWGLAIMASFPLLLIAATIGLLRPGALSTQTGVLIASALLCVVAIHVLSFGDSRFHLPWIPLISVFAARAFSSEDPRQLTWPRRVALFVCVVVLTVMWGNQLVELLRVLPRLAESPVPVRLPF